MSISNNVTVQTAYHRLRFVRSQVLAKLRNRVAEEEGLPASPLIGLDPTRG